MNDALRTKANRLKGGRLSASSLDQQVQLGSSSRFNQVTQHHRQRRAGGRWAALVVVAICLALRTLWAELGHSANQQGSPQSGSKPSSDLSQDLPSSPEVQFDNYTLFLKGQRVFLQYVAREPRTLHTNPNIGRANSIPFAYQSHRYGPTSLRRRKQLGSMPSAFTFIWA